MIDDSYKIKLPLFEGPMDLLLHLIRENKIDIYDIPIALITRQYLEYIEMMKELNLEIAGDFIVMAATLIHIKSRMLLPIEETAGTEEPEDPRLELVMRLLEYKAYKDAALGLKEREEEWSQILPRSPLPEEEAAAEPEQALFDLNLYDLLSAFKQMLEKAPPEIRTITKETLTVKDRMNAVIEALQVARIVKFESLFKDGSSVAHYLVTFIAILELIKLGLAKVYQEREFGTIWVINSEEGTSPLEIAVLKSEPFSVRKEGDAVVRRRPGYTPWITMKAKPRERKPDTAGTSIPLPERAHRLPVRATDRMPAKGPFCPLPGRKRLP